ncbi:MAG TPA: T9SS type A sorting domain-containing protein [Candidatus Kapabacteria bacterium]|nr:T9SS type A sorting domain-containing protein [Candidatus Kapabacteria bacterium]
MKKQLQRTFLIAIVLFFAITAHAQTSKTLIHYWNLDNTPTATITPATPTIPDITADYSALDKSKARVTYYLLPGTSLTASKRYIDPVAGVDSINARLTVVPTGSGGNNALRLRNPLDSMELRIYAPTTGFSNIVFKYALQSSSNTNGDSTDWFDYSIDSGKTWKSGLAGGMKVNGRLSDTVSTLWNMYQGDVNWGLVTVDLSADPAVGNNPNFVLRIRFRNGANHTSGNNRLDNFTFEGNGASHGPPPVITLKQPGNNILVVGKHTTIAFDTLNGVGSTKTLEYSTDGGTTWSSVGTTTATTYDWVVPNTPTSNGIVRVKDAEGTIGKSQTFVIVSIDPKKNRVIHYWDFNNLTKVYHNPGIPSIAPDFSIFDNTTAAIVYKLESNVSSTYAGYLDNVPGDTINAQFGAAPVWGLRVRNPTDSMELRLLIPTTGYKNISLSYALQSSGIPDAPATEHFDYSVDGGITWKKGVMINGIADTLDVTQAQYQGVTFFGRVNLNFGTDQTVNNNSNLILRIKFGGIPLSSSGNNRFDNITVMGDPSSSAVEGSTSINMDYAVYPNPAADYIIVSAPSEGSKTIAILDLSGKTVLSTSTPEKYASVNTSKLASGMYIIHIIDEALHIERSLKFVKE